MARDPLLEGLDELIASMKRHDVLHLLLLRRGIPVWVVDVSAVPLLVTAARLDPVFAVPADMGATMRRDLLIDDLAVDQRPSAPGIVAPVAIGHTVRRGRDVHVKAYDLVRGLLVLLDVLLDRLFNDDLGKAGRTRVTRLRDCRVRRNTGVPRRACSGSRRGSCRSGSTDETDCGDHEDQRSIELIKQLDHLQVI
jgi:hypothetical protein